MDEAKEKIEQELRKGADPARFEEIYLAYYKGIYNYIYSFVRHRETAEDVTADVFASVYRNLAKLDLSRGTFSSWIYAIARNAVKDMRKRAAFRCEVLGVMPETAASETPFAENGGWDDTLKNPDNVWLQGLLEHLDEEEINLLMLRYQMGFSNQEVGKILNLSADAVSKRYRRLLMRCRKLGQQEQT